MAVGGKPNGSYIFNVVLPAEFRAVSQPSYFTDVDRVDTPLFGPDEPEQILGACAEGPAILLWVDSESEGGLSGPVGGPASDRCSLKVIIVGALRRHDGIQEAIQGLAADIRRVMRGNPKRTYPGSTDTNEYGVNTVSAGSPTFDFGYYTKDKMTAAMVYSLWDIEYKFPLSTG